MDHSEKRSSAETDSFNDDVLEWLEELRKGHGKEEEVPVVVDLSSDEDVRSVKPYESFADVEELLKATELAEKTAALPQNRSFTDVEGALKEAELPEKAAAAQENESFSDVEAALKAAELAEKAAAAQEDASFDGRVPSPKVRPPTIHAPFKDVTSYSKMSEKFFLKVLNRMAETFPGEDDEDPVAYVLQQEGLTEIPAGEPDLVDLELDEHASIRNPSPAAEAVAPEDPTNKKTNSDSFLSSCESVAKHFVGLENLTNTQKDCLATLHRDEDCIALLPTSFGKSLVYQVFGLGKSEICSGDKRCRMTLYICAFASIVKDQSDKLTKWADRYKG